MASSSALRSSHRSCVGPSGRGPRPGTRSRSRRRCRQGRATRAAGRYPRSRAAIPPARRSGCRAGCCPPSDHARATSGAELRPVDRRRPVFRDPLAGDDEGVTEVHERTHRTATPSSTATSSILAAVNARGPPPRCGASAPRANAGGSGSSGRRSRARPPPRQRRRPGWCDPLLPPARSGGVEDRRRDALLERVLGGNGVGSGASSGIPDSNV